MLKKITLTITSDNQPIHAAWGYALYGMIISQANQEYVEYIHSEDGFALHQYIQGSGMSAKWVINLLGAEACEQLSPIFLQKYFDIEYFNSKLTVQNCQIETLEEQEFCLKYLTQHEPKRQIKLKFLTPCSFKSQKRYQIFPKEDWIINSLWKHWQSYAQEIILDDDEVKKQIIERIAITGYNLRSTDYKLKGQRIASFIGTINLKINGPAPLVGLTDMLFNFGAYSGIGIKNALGMGGICIL